MQRREFLRSLPLVWGVPVFLGFRKGRQFPPDDPDALLCARKFEMAVARGLQKLPIGEVVVEIGKSFLGTDYVAHALEVPGEERLVVNMRGLDCVSFCENAVVLARCIKKHAMTFEDYKKELQYLRYRGGIIDRYPSRLHYFTDYIYDGEKKGIWRNVTKLLGGKPYRKIINFMSRHPEAYRQLREHADFVEIVRRQEAEISQREHWYIPKTELRAVEVQISNGDILAIATSIEGLDVSHTGVAFHDRGRLHMMHAPDVGSKVTVTELPLAEYLAKNRTQTGIIVARPLEPR
jgi:hypothetical protein